ncbi:Serine/threonine-protein phosphatase UIS2 [Dirofilaria immitis]
MTMNLSERPSFRKKLNWIEFSIQITYNICELQCKYYGMRLYLAIDVLLLLVLRIKSNRIILHRFSLFIQQHCCNNISQIHRLNDCKYSKVRMKIDKKILIIVSKTEWCNEAIKVVFGKSAEARRNRSDAISWVTPYNFTGLMNLHSKWRYDAYFDNVTRTAHGLARIDLLCPKRRSHSGRRILKRSIQENKQEKSRRSFTVNIYGSSKGIFTITVGVVIYAIFGVCFLITNMAYLSGIYTVHNTSVIPEDKKRKETSKRKEIL